MIQKKGLVTPSTRFEDEVVFFNGDIGNQGIKSQLMGQRDTASVITNQVAFLTENKWQQHKTRWKFDQDRFRNTQVFAFRSRLDKKKMIYVAVGDNAHLLGGELRILTEEIKYDYDLYWGAVLGAALLQNFPEGSKSIVAAIAHPTKSIGQRPDMLEASAGAHYYEMLDGRRVTCVIKEVRPWDESVGGMVAWTEQNEFQYNATEFEAGDMVMVFDMGGGVTSLTQVQIDRGNDGRLMFVPVYDLELSPSISVGVRSIKERLRNNLTVEHPKFKGRKNISDRELEHGLRYHKIEVSSVPVDVTEEVWNAESPFINQVSTLYAQKMDGGRSFKAIVCTGGGETCYFDRLKNEVWNHPNVYLAAPMPKIHLANIYGGDEMFRQWVEQQRKMKLKGERRVG